MKKLLLGSVLALSFSLLSCNDNSSSGPDKKEGGGIEVPCNAENEGEVVNPADSDKEYICKNSSWNVVAPPRHCEDCKDETIAISSSSSNNNAILSASDKSSSSIITTSVSDESSSSVIASETKQSSSEQSTESSNSEVGDSSSSVETTEDESSCSEETDESSSSEETAMFLCDDGVTYVLDLANCEVESSSSEDAGESSSSETTTQSSSEKVEESSSSEVPVESSSSEVNAASSSSLNSVYDAENNTLTDLRDGQVYKTVTIGSQVWMAENLNYLPKDTVGTVFAGLSICGGGEIGSMQEGDCSVYGRLYEKNINAYDHYNENICPDDWNVPTLTQWKTLVNYVGGNTIAGNVLKSNNNSNWSGTNHTDKYGFSATPAVFFHETKGFNYKNNEKMAVFTIHNFKSYESNAIRIYDTQDTVNFKGFGNGYYLAVRCIKD